MFELVKIMRQLNDALFAEILTRLGRGLATVMDCQYFENLRRPVSEISYCDDYIHLFWRNVDVDKYNREAIKWVQGKEEYCDSLDEGKPSVLKRVPHMDLKSKHGLMDRIHLKENAKYMVIQNIDVEDGIVNGSTGILKDWTYETNATTGEKRICRIWMLFEDPIVGFSARMATPHGSDSRLTPIERYEQSICTKIVGIVKFVRKQFPLAYANAITVHKAQVILNYSVIMR